MRNLHVIQTNKAQLGASIVGQCIDADNKRFFLLTEDINVFEVRGDKRNVPVKLVPQGRESLPKTYIKQDDVILIEYIVETGSICVVLKTGEFFRIGVSSFSPPSGYIYKHSKPICSVKFSPDQDLVAIADTHNDISIFSSDLTLVHSSNALTENNSAHKPVGVGWGSKETQFFGLDGRPSKEKASKHEVVLGEEELSAVEAIEKDELFIKFRQANESNTILDWRGDGQLLATFTFIPDSGKHFLKVWNRNLQLQYMSEQLVAMERGILSWVPNGQYVCTAQRRDNRINEITMFEKNGMVHQRITLPTFIPHLYIKNLIWSPDSSILAIILVEFNINDHQTQKRSMIMLYTMQNFHYYLKYSSYLTLGGSDYTLRWDPNHNSILYVASDDGSFVEYNCTSLVDLCQDGTTVAVIDANKVMLTPFSICNIPPPMSAMIVELEVLINRVVLAPGFEQMFIKTVDGKMIFRTFNQHNQSQDAKVTHMIENQKIKHLCQEFGCFKSIYFEKIQDYQNFMIIDTFTLIATRQVEASCELTLLEIDNPLDPSLKIKTLKIFQNQEVISIVQDSYDPNTNSLHLLLDDYSCNLVDLKSGESKTTFIFKTTADRLYIKQAQYVKTFNLVLMLTSDMTLWANNNVIVSNSCTSFKVTSNFIIYTAIDHIIHFVPLDILSSSEIRNEVDSWNQPIENGGVLVVASESDSKVILQMPRGNLEILHPRIMVLLRITNHLDHDEFLSAFKLARRYRVDLNFLADYMLRCDEVAFYDDKLNKFANDLAQQDPTLLNLFITELTSDDTTIGRYESAMKFLPISSRPVNNEQVSLLQVGKVNRICSSISLPSESQYLQPKLLCLIKQEPRKSDQALSLIYKLADKGEREATLKFLLYFISIEQLFVDAIATYDTDIAIMVAGVSSKDPKEYLALLESFDRIEQVHLRRYKMDYHIKNYERAFTNLLIHLQDASNKDSVKTELLEIVVAKRIYRHAIQSCFDQYVNFVSLEDQCKVDKTFEQLSMDLWTRYGDYLLEKRYYLEAGLAYSKSLAIFRNDRNLDNAIKCFLLADDWERCVAAVESHKLPESKRIDVLKNISSNLMLRGDYASSVLIMSVPKNDELAFKLVEKGSWYLSQLVVSEISRHKLHQEISQSISWEFNNLTPALNACLNSAKERYRRLKELFLTPPKTDHFDSENCYTADSLSTVDGSETLSVSYVGNKQSHVARSGAPSIKTRASTKSNKSQSAKRKKINLKAGSRYEDMALVIELKKFITDQRSNQASARNLIAAHIEFLNPDNIDKRYEPINDLLKQSHHTAREILSSLWPKLDQEDNIYSVYKRYAKTLCKGDYVDNLDLEILLRPELPESCLLLEF